MPTYHWKCPTCDAHWSAAMSVAEYVEWRDKYPCQDAMCPNRAMRRVFDPVNINVANLR